MVKFFVKNLLVDCKVKCCITNFPVNIFTLRFPFENIRLRFANQKFYGDIDLSTSPSSLKIPYPFTVHSSQFFKLFGGSPDLISESIVS